MTARRIRALVDRSLEMIESEEHREKRMTADEQSLRDLWNNIRGLMFVCHQSHRRHRLVQEKKKLKKYWLKISPIG